MGLPTVNYTGNTVLPTAAPIESIGALGDAISKGSEAGRVNPTALNSAVTGTLEGIKQGQQIESTNLNQQLTQNQIANSQQEQQARALQMQNQVSTNSINSNKAMIDAQTVSLQLDKAKSDLNSDISDNQDNIDDNDAEASFNDPQTGWSSLDPQQQKENYFNGNYNRAFSSNPDLEKQAGSQLLASGILNEDETRAVQYRTGKGQIDNYYAHKNFADQDANTKAAQAWEGSIPNTQISHALGDIPPEQTYGKYSLVPADQFKMDHGQFAVDPSSGQKIPSGLYNPHATVNNWVVTDPEQKKIIAPNVIVPSGKDGVDALTKAQRARNYLNGTYQTNATKALHGSIYDQATEKTPPPANTFPMVRGAGTPSSKQSQGLSVSDDPTLSTAQKEALSDPFVQKATATLSVPTNTAREVSPLMMQFKQDIIKASNGKPIPASAVSGLVQGSPTAKTLIRGITDSQFNQTPALQQSYTPAKIQEHNDAIDAKLKDPVYSGIDNTVKNLFSGKPAEQIPPTMKAMLQSGYVKTPQDLYYQNQLPILQGKLTASAQDLVNTSYMKDTTLQRQSSASSQQAVIFGGWANGNH